MKELCGAFLLSFQMIVSVQHLSVKMKTFRTCIMLEVAL